MEINVKDVERRLNERWFERSMAKPELTVITFGPERKAKDGFEWVKTQILSGKEKEVWIEAQIRNGGPWRVS